MLEPEAPNESSAHTNTASVTETMEIIEEIFSSSPFKGRWAEVICRQSEWTSEKLLGMQD